MAETETAAPRPSASRTWKARGGLALVALAAAAYFVWYPGRGVDLPPIRQHGSWIVIENQTTSPWKDVSVTVNAYYRGVSPALGAGGRLEAPLAGFTTGLGRRFDTGRERVSRVEVRATDAAGRLVALDWDEKTGPPLVQEGK